MIPAVARCAGALVFCIAIGGHIQARAYDDSPFTMSTTVDEKGFVVIAGRIYTDLTIEYRPGLQQVFVNGDPIFRIELAIGDEECASSHEDNPCIAAYIEEGLDCAEARLRFEDELNKLCWDLGDWREAAPDSGVTEAAVTAICRSSSIAAAFASATVDEGAIAVRFMGFDRLRIPRPDERPELGGALLPFRESVLRWAEGLVRAVQPPRKWPTMKLYTSSLAAMSLSSRTGEVEAARRQFAAIQVTGGYVEGPIPPDFVKELLDRGDR